MIAAILLAAGTSSRTGKKHKLLLPYKKKSIVAHSINNLLNSNVDRIIVIVGKSQHEVKKHITQHKKIKIYYNQSYRSGMASSIKIGMKHLPRKTKSFFITLADMPNLESKYFNTMIKVSKKNSNIPIVTYFQKKQVNPVLFPYSFKKKLMTLQGDRGAKLMLQEEKIKIYYNQSYRSGMASSIKIGMKYLPRKTKSFFITLADMPNLESKYFNTMIKVSKNNSNIPIVTYFQKKQVNPVLFPYSFKKKLMTLQGDRGAKLMLQKEKIKKINIKKFNLIKDFDTLKDFKQ